MHDGTTLNEVLAYYDSLILLFCKKNSHIEETIIVRD